MSDTSIDAQTLHPIPTDQSDDATTRAMVAMMTDQSFTSEAVSALEEQGWSLSVEPADPRGSWQVGVYLKILMEHAGEFGFDLGIYKNEDEDRAVQPWLFIGSNWRGESEQLVRGSVLDSDTMTKWLGAELARLVTPAVTEAALCASLESYCKTNGIPHESADELLLRDDLTDDQRIWLSSFYLHWEAWERVDQEARMA